MPEPKPPKGYETWIDAILAEHGGVFSEYKHPLRYARAEYVTLREKEDSWDTFLRQRNRYQGFTPEKDSEPLCRIRDALNLTHWLCESVDNESDGPEDEEVKQAQAELATLRAEAEKWRAYCQQYDDSEPGKDADDDTR